jgi:hypothetical protein
VAERLKAMVKKDAGLALCVTSDALLTPRGAFGDFSPARHGGILPENQPACQHHSSAKKSVFHPPSSVAKLPP